MAKTQTIEVPDELTGLFDKALERGDRFVYGTIQAHKRVASRATKEKLKGQSLFGFLATIWRTLTDEDKAWWKQAAAFSNLTNWQLFISDNAARLREDLDLNKPVSTRWQVRVGRLQLTGAAEEIKITQIHPLDYWVSRKMPGKPWKQELVLVREALTLPLTLGVSWKGSLIASGSAPSARLVARFYTSIQGIETITDLVLPLSSADNWQKAEASINSLKGSFLRYEVFFHIEDYQGDLFFDNLIVEHSGQNWGRDPRADNIEKVFVKAFALVRPFWVPEVQPVGATFETVYIPFTDDMGFDFLYMGAVLSDGSASTPFPSGWTVEKTSTGKYTITHNLGSTDYAIVISPVGTNPRMARVRSKDLNTAELTFTRVLQPDSLPLADSGFDFLILIP